MFKSHQVEMRTVVNSVLLNYSHSQHGMILTLNATFMMIITAVKDFVRGTNALVEKTRPD
jgi:hypothetical protein